MKQACLLLLAPAFLLASCSEGAGPMRAEARGAGSGSNGSDHAAPASQGGPGGLDEPAPAPTIPAVPAHEDGIHGDEIRPWAAAQAAGDRQVGDGGSAQGPLPHSLLQGHEGHDHPPTPLPPAPTVPGPGFWFEELQRDLGVHLEGRLLTADFPFENRSGSAQKIVNVLPDCACASTWIEMDGRVIPVKSPFEGEVEVPDGQQGIVKVQLDITNYVGVRSGNVRIQTTDPAMPLVSLGVKAEARRFFHVSPQDVNLGEMQHGDQRQFSVTVYSPYAEDFNIVRTEGLPPLMEVTTEKIQVGDRMGHRIDGTMGPGLAEGQGGGRVTFHTDLEGDRSFQVTVSALVQGPMRMEPGAFLAFGGVRSAEGRTLEVKVENLDTSHELAVEKVELLDLQGGAEEHLGHEVRPREDGKRGLVVAFTVKPGTPRAQFRGRVLIHFNHPLVPQRELRFSAIVR